MAELIKMAFGIWTRAGPRKHVLINRPSAATMRPCVRLLWSLIIIAD